MFTQADIINLLSQYAYEPTMIYTLVLLFMTASSFGFPVPEEVVLLSAGLLAFFAHHPETYPPPFPGATPINAYVLSAICFLSVFLSDLLVFSIGRIGGMRLLQSQRLKKYIVTSAFQKSMNWVQKYGAWMAGVFRFLPVLRFPGHLTCGILGLRVWKFCAVDGIAALLTVPTQILLMAHYGDVFLEYFKQFKLAILGLILTGVLVYFLRKHNYFRFFFKNQTDKV